MSGRSACILAVALLLASSPACAADTPHPAGATTRNGRDIYQRFHDGLADPVCDKDSSSRRWRRHFANAPWRLVDGDDDTMALFGYVVDALRASSLPTEYALIPFVESGYKPGARSPGGPAGMWQMIAVTARNHHVVIRNGYDGRLSPIDSTRAAVRYLKTLHGMFAGDWRLAVMAYNAGEYRVFGALRRSGQAARDADPEKLTSLSGITRAYVRKLHALSCLLDRADDDPHWLQAIDRPVPVLDAVALPKKVASLDAWARAHHRDPARIRHLNPAFLGGRVSRIGRKQRLLVPEKRAIGAGDIAADSANARATIAPDPAAGLPATAIDTGGAAADGTPSTHVVASGESAWEIAHRYHISTSQLLWLNGLTAASVLRPGMVLRLRAETVQAAGE